MLRSSAPDQSSTARVGGASRHLLSVHAWGGLWRVRAGGSKFSVQSHTSQRAGTTLGERTSEVPVTRTLVVVALLWALPSALGAQTPFGRINGFTILSSGQLVGGVTVTATNARGSTQSTVSTPNGTFTFDSLSPGNYRLRATRQGLQPESTTVQVGTGSVDVRIVFSPVVSPPLGRILGLTVLPSGQGEGYRLLGPDPADLTSQATTQQSDADLLRTIHEGKPNMPVWKYRLSKQDSRNVLAYIRSLQQ